MCTCTNNQIDAVILAELYTNQNRTTIRCPTKHILQMISLCPKIYVAKVKGDTGNNKIGQRYAESNEWR